MTRRIRPLVLIGERPGPRTDPERPLYPHTTTGAAARLIDLLGLPREDYFNLTTRINAFNDGCRPLSLEEARRRVTRHMIVAINRYVNPRFVFLGAEALRCGPQIYRRMQPADVRDLVMYLPHPSGVNRWYNSSENTELARARLREHVQPALQEEAWRKLNAQLVRRGNNPAPARVPGAGVGQEDAVRALQALTAALPGAKVPATPPHTPEEVVWLLGKWDRETGVLSSTTAIAAHPIARQLLREEGLRLVPHLIENLRKAEPAQPWGCFVLLQKVTGVWPAKPEDAGRYEAARQAWIQWYDTVTAG